jgi:hypothetical protein
MRTPICTLFVLLVAATRSFSQDARPVMDELAKRISTAVTPGRQAAVYVNTSKAIYVGGEDLWFHAFVLDAQTFFLFQPDKTLYVQLQQQDGDSIVWQEMYPIVNGVAAGHVYLSQTLPVGDYVLRCYTAHSFVPNQSPVYGATVIRVVKDLRSRRGNPRMGGSKGMPAAQGMQQAKQAIQFRMFPEGGNLVAGVKNQVAFKAVHADGSPARVSGTLLAGGKAIVSFTTVHAGMGSFVLAPETNAQYQVRLDQDPDSLYTLPAVNRHGITMRLLKNDTDSLVFRIATPGSREKQRVFLRLQLRGMVQAIAAGWLTDSLDIHLPVTNSSPGIAEATLFDEQLRPLAERLVYLHPDQRLRVQFSGLKEQYEPKEKVSFTIRTTDPAGHPVPAVVSLRVFDYLFDEPGNTRDLVNYCYLSTQLRGQVYDPSYYFDSSHANRQAALDLLLLTQGWRRYTWNETALQEEAATPQPVLSDSVEAQLVPVRKTKKERQSMSLLLSNFNKGKSQVTATDSAGKFYLTPADLAMGSRVFIKYFSEEAHRIHVTDPFAHFKVPAGFPALVFAAQAAREEGPVADTSDLLQYGKTLEAVTVSAKGRGYNDKYLGYLDSVAKYEGNTDYVGACGWLNCPACGSGKKPVEGVTYSELIESKRSQVTSHPFSFTTDDRRKGPYHYPRYTEEELLQQFKMGVTKGYYQSRQFYEPDYDVEPASVPDNRNTLAWAPSIITNERGEATVHFFCSDIRSRFLCILEGVGEDGLLGAQKMPFLVR